MTWSVCAGESKRAVAAILDEHGPEVTSYDGYDLTGCRSRDCDDWRPSPDGDAWVEHARHQAEALAGAGLLRTDVDADSEALRNAAWSAASRRHQYFVTAYDSARCGAPTGISGPCTLPKGHRGSHIATSRSTAWPGEAQ